MELKPYSNKYLQEVICGFGFLESGVDWSSIYFGQYANEIKDLNFNIREEHKGFQINFAAGEPDPNSLPDVSAQEVESKMLFRNENLGQAIMLAKDQISFHNVNKNYEGWESFLKGLVKSGMKAYDAVGLLKGKIRANMVYINRFVFLQEEVLSDYFNFLGPVDTKFGTETNTLVERIFDIQEGVNTLVVRLRIAPNPDGTKGVILQTGAITKQNLDEENLDWETLSGIAHEPIKEFFDSLITDKLKAIL